MATSIEMCLSVGQKEPQTSVLQRIAAAQKLGYSVIVLSNELPVMTRESSQNAKKKKKEKAMELVIPSADYLKSCIPSDLPLEMKCYTRITFRLEDLSFVHKLQKNRELLSYDIVAIQPTTDKVFQAACENFDFIDMISLDLTSKLSLNIKRGMLNRAFQSGMHFDIAYAPALKESVARRHTISGAQKIVRLLRGHGIVVSSHSEKSIELRSPKDVACMSSLFDMSEGQGHAATKTNAHAVLSHARARRMTGSAVTMATVAETPKAIVDLVIKHDVVCDATSSDSAKRSLNDDNETNVKRLKT